MDVEDFGRRYTEAWNSSDPGSVAAFHEPDSSLRVNDAEPAVGHEAITDVASGFMESFPDMELLMDGIEGDARSAVYAGRSSARTRDRRHRTSGAVQRLRGVDSERERAHRPFVGHFDAEDYERQLAGG